MSIHYNKQSQFELFPEALRNSADNTRAGFFRTTLTLSLDNIVVLGIVVTMMLVMSFALGVERGRGAKQSAPRRLRSPMSRAAVTRRAVQRRVTRRVVKPARVVENRPVAVAPLTPVSGKAPSTQEINPLGKPDQGLVSSPQMLKAGIAISLPGDPPLKRNSMSSQEIVVDLTRVEGATGGEEKKIDKIYTVQVASYSSAAFAQPALEEMEKNGLVAEVIPKGKYFILCVGKYPARKEAERAQQKLRKKFKDCNIRSL